MFSFGRRIPKTIQSESNFQKSHGIIFISRPISNVPNIQSHSIEESTFRYFDFSPIVLILGLGLGYLFSSASSASSSLC